MYAIELVEKMFREGSIMKMEDLHAAYQILTGEGQEDDEFQEERPERAQHRGDGSLQTGG